MVDPCNRLHNFIVFLLPSIVGFQFCLMKHQSVLFSLFKGVIANGLNWLRALESMVMKKIKIKIKISFTSRPMEQEFYNDLVYIFKKIMDRTDLSESVSKITMSQMYWL